MVSAELFAQLQRIVQKVVRVRSGYKRRAQDRSERPFGGINVMLFGDWWQLRPVCGTAIFSNPLLVSRMAQSCLNMFWGDDADRVRRVWELTQPMRCEDTW